MDPLRNYFDLVSRVDELCQRIETDFRMHLACRKGCDACCRHFSLFPVEAAALVQALDSRGAEEKGRIRSRARLAPEEGPCPLLQDGACLLYEARPIICRTHGLPLLAGTGKERLLDWCPENFKGVKSLPDAAVINLDVLNTTLATINSLFLAEIPAGKLHKERFLLSNALMLDLA
jgi:Fe-S-cluster containining protein